MLSVYSLARVASSGHMCIREKVKMLVCLGYDGGDCDGHGLDSDRPRWHHQLNALSTALARSWPVCPSASLVRQLGVAQAVACAGWSLRYVALLILPPFEKTIGCRPA